MPIAATTGAARTTTSGESTPSAPTMTPPGPGSRACARRSTDSPRPAAWSGVRASRRGRRPFSVLPCPGVNAWAAPSRRRQERPRARPTATGPRAEDRRQVRCGDAPGTPVGHGTRRRPGTPERPARRVDEAGPGPTDEPRRPRHGGVRDR
jgi:hypothetical protein